MCGSSDTVLALQVQSPDFKPQSHTHKKMPKGKKVYVSFFSFLFFEGQFCKNKTPCMAKQRLNGRALWENHISMICTNLSFLLQ
jgi:hypothetical protein